MADPWSILGLRSDTADEKQVRSAYARLLKVHRPDQDPEGFQRLRSAYEQALEWLQFRAASEEEPPNDTKEWEPEEKTPAVLESAPADSDPAPAPPSPLPTSWAEGEVPVLPHKLDQTPLPELHQRKPQRPERDWPREWSYSIESLERALQGEPRQFDAVPMALKALATDVVECGIPPYALECILKDAFQDQAWLFGMNVPECMVLWLLEGGCIAFLNDSLDALQQADKPMHMIQLAQKFDECSIDALSLVTVAIYFRVAGMAAIHNPFIAKSIGRKLRRLLDEDSHQAQFDQLHDAIMRGMAFSGLVQEHRSFWVHRLEHPKASCDWKAGLPGQALAAVVLLGKKWVGMPLVQSVVPAEIWENAWKGRWLKVAVHGITRTRNLNLKSMMFALIGCMFFVYGLRIFNETTASQKTEPVSQAEEFRRNFQIGAELLKKHQEELRKKGEIAKPDGK